MPSIGKYIRKYRKQKHWTQEKLGEVTNISRQQICNYEGDKIDPPALALVSISKALDVTPNELLKDYICSSEVSCTLKRQLDRLLSACSAVELNLLLNIDQSVLNAFDQLSEEES